MTASNPPIDYSDPCAAYERLQNAYYALLEGRQPSLTEFEVGTGTRRRVEFAQVNANLIRQELARLRRECERKRGVYSRRVTRGG